MPRSKKANAEIIRVGPQMDLEALDRLIQKRVAEATASQGAILEPWFQSKAVSTAIRRHESIFHKRKFALHFEKFGCLVCGTKNRPHETHAMCAKCVHKFVHHLTALEREYAKAHPHEYENQQIDNLTSRIRSAKRILGTARTLPAVPAEGEE